MAPPANSSEFLTKLRDERVSLGTKDRVLLAPLVYYSALLADLVIVPVDFVTDYASVPRAPLTYWLFGGIGDEAAVVHDFLYEKGIVPREVADNVYLEALGAMGIPEWQRGPMWAAVRVFGSRRYKSVPTPAKAA